VGHERDLADQDVEEIAEEIWTLGEQGRNTVLDLERTSQVGDVSAALEAMGRRGLARVEGGSIVLTAAGRALAERQVRRHRLAEALFTTVLEVRDDDAVNRTACVMEHVLGAAMTDSICAFLGHPKVCPHGKPIPPGACCWTLTRPVEPVVQPLGRLAVGTPAQVVHVAPTDPGRLVRLANLGIVPGATLRLDQKSPAAIIRVGETALAVDPAVVDEIYVKRAG
jgi:DtxR family Mn-dependent transcriptional regulator